MLSKARATEPLGTPVPAGRAANSLIPLVRGILDGDIADAWPGQLVIERTVRGRVCRVIEFTPERGAPSPWDGFQITTPMSSSSRCSRSAASTSPRSISAKTIRPHETKRKPTCPMFLDTPVEERREILLEPGEEYEIEIGWSWQAWQRTPTAPTRRPRRPPALGRRAQRRKNSDLPQRAKT